MHSSPGHPPGDSPCDATASLEELGARLAAGGALAERLRAGGAREVCERLGEALHETTGLAHTFVSLRAADTPQVCGYRSRAAVACTPAQLAAIAERLMAGLQTDATARHMDAGMRFVAVAIPMRERAQQGVTGALCFSLADGEAFDAAALVQLAEQGARSLERTRPQARRATDLAHGADDDRELVLLRTLIDNMPDHIYAKDRNGRFILGNRAAAIGILGRDDVPALIGKSDLDFYPLACGQRFFTDEQGIIRTGEPIIDQVEENVTKDGPLRYFSTTKFPFRDEQGEIAGIVGISRDITARVGADEVARIRDRAVESSQDGILITGATDREHAVIYTNPAFERLTGFGTAQARQCGIERFLRDDGGDGGDGADEPAARQERSRVDRGALIAGHGQQRVLRARRRDGTHFWCEVRLATICAPDGSASHHVFTFVDVTEAHRAEEELVHLAGHDALTGLPNRRLLMERIGREVRTGAAAGTVLAVAFIDLDGLKRLNDEHGHEAGDQLLRAVADRISGRIRESDMVARLGGDEFVLVSLHGAALLHDTAPLLAFLRTVRDGIALPLSVAGTVVTPSCSIGVSVLGRHGYSAEALLRQADAAMYAAKRSGPGRIVLAQGE